MLIQLKKFGTVLTSRQAGKEALAAFFPSLQSLKESEPVEISFEEVEVFSPSWGDEFLRPLHEKYGKGLFLHESDNASVTLTLKFLEEVNHMRFTKSGRG